MRYEPEAPPLVISPHLDDAVLSVYTVLAGTPAALVANVFDGVPPPGPPPFSVRLCRATDAAAQMRRRHAEDEAALASVGCDSISFGLLEADSRDAGDDPDAIEVARALDAAVEAASVIHAPIGIGSHPDHVIARDAALALSAELSVPLALYADIPYAITWGWPPWVSGEPADPNLDPDAQWQRGLGRLPVAGTDLDPEVVALDGQAQDRKRAAVGMYESQLSMLAGGPHRRLDGWALTREVRWHVAPAAISTESKRPRIRAAR